MIELHCSKCFTGVALALAGLLLFAVTGCADPPLTATPGTTRTLNPDLLGANANLTAFDRPWEHSELMTAFREMGVGNLRYPAGTLGNYWDWDIGWVDQSVPDSLMIKWVVENNLRDLPARYTLENLALVVRETGVVPVFMLNMLSKDLDHSLRNLRRAHDLGIPIRYVELGNELYFDIPFPKLRFATPEAYGDTCQAWITVLEEEFPTAEFAVVGTDMTRHARQRNWTRRVLEHCDKADAVTFHKYAPSGLDGRRAKKYLRPGNEGTSDPVTETRTGPETVVERQGWERELLAEPAAYANLLTNAAESAAGWRHYGIPEGMDVWATEFNMRDDSSVVLHGWAHGLLLSTYFAEFYRSPVTLACVHNLVGNTFGLIHDNPGGLAHVRDRPRSAEPFTLTAGGVVLSLFAAASRDARFVTPLVYPDCPQLKDDRGNTFATLRGWRFSGEAERALLINYGLEPATVTLPEGFTTAQTRAYSAPADRSISGWWDVKVTVPRAVQNRITLPPRSLVLFSYDSVFPDP